MWLNAGRFLGGDGSSTRGDVDVEQPVEECEVQDATSASCTEEEIIYEPNDLEVTRRSKGFGVLVEPACPGADVVWQSSSRDIGAQLELWRQMAKQAAKLFPKAL